MHGGGIEIPYTKTTWVEGGAPGISGANLNNLETQYDEALAADTPQKLKPAVTRWVIPGWYASTPSARGLITLSAGRIYYIPIFVSESTTYIRIGIYVGTLSAGIADLRIFAWNNGLPGALLLSAGTVDTGSTGAKEIEITQVLTKGYYFLAVRATGTPTLRTLQPTDAVMPPVPGINEEGLIVSTPYGCCLSVGAAYADPAPAPDGTWSALAACVQLREN